MATGRAMLGQKHFTVHVIAFQVPMTRLLHTAPTFVRIWVILNSTFMIPLRAYVARGPTRPPAFPMGRYLGARTTCILRFRYGYGQLQLSMARTRRQLWMAGTRRQLWMAMDSCSYG